MGNLRKSGITPVGFYTEELRSVGRDGREGARIGFDVVDLEGRRCPLARIRDDMRYICTFMQSRYIAVLVLLSHNYHVGIVYDVCMLPLS